VEKIFIMEIKWNAEEKCLFLIGFPLYRSHIASWETRFSINSRTIRRGSWVSKSII
jgi:hypothetical protein